MLSKVFSLLLCALGPVSRSLLWRIWENRPPGRMAYQKIGLLENCGVENWPPLKKNVKLLKSLIDKQFVLLNDLTKKKTLVLNTNAVKCKKCISLIKKTILHDQAPS